MNMHFNIITNECLACGSLNINTYPAFFMPFISDRAFKNPMLRVTKETTGLRDILDGYTYQHCNSLYCKSCGHLACDLRFNEEQMKNLYHDYRGSDYLKLREFYEPGYIKRNDVFNHEYHYHNLVENFIFQSIGIKPLSVLDWGGDSGINTPFKKVIEIHHIFDISDVKPIQGALVVGSEIISDFRYDLVVCQHVLEHLPFPGVSIINLLRNIKGNPYFYFEVPHEPVIRATSHNEVPRKMHWHEHINFYTESSLEKLLGRCGLKVINVNSTNVAKNEGEDTFILQCTAELI